MHYANLSPEFTAKFFELMRAAKRIIITGHMQPDEDAFAAALATYDILQQKVPGKDVRMVFSAEPTTAFTSFAHFDRIEFVPDIADVVQASDTLVVLDGGQLYRFSRQPEKLAAVRTRICIDHHASPPDDFTLSLIVPALPAATEMVYRALGADIAPSKQLAEILLLGIFGDTGTLAYLKPSQTETLTLVKKLLDISKVEVQEFISRYETISQREFAVFMEFCKNTRFGKAEGWPDFQYAFLSNEFVREGGYSDPELTKGSALYKDAFLRKVDAHPWGFMVKPTVLGVVSVSARSLPGSVNVRDMMERIGIGGGHDRAAGGEIKDGDADKALEFILAWIKKNKPVIS